MQKFYRDTSNGGLGFFIETDGTPLSFMDLEKIRWLITETFEPEKTGFNSHFTDVPVVEIGPRISIETPFSSNAVSICHAMGMCHVVRIECTRQYPITKDQSYDMIIKNNLDRMTETIYQNGIETFVTGISPEPIRVINVLGAGSAALNQSNRILGLGMDRHDIKYYYDLFASVLKRNPTDVELFQLGNANSEHSRHWYFKGKIVIDGVVMSKTLFEIVQRPLQSISGFNRSLIAFRDNSGAVSGFQSMIMIPEHPGKHSKMVLARKMVHITCTAETHNHPTFVAPFPGAETGTGGRIRDNCAVGRGGIIGAGIAGYFVGNLFIPGYKIPGEIIGSDRPSVYASPLSILLEGSDGISSYGNKIGEPLILGYTRTFGQKFNNEWREPRKPILYTAGVGHMHDEHLVKALPEIGMLIVRIGGPAYPIGVGGGSASSMMQGQNTETLDFNSVQRGNAAMEGSTNRIIRTCIEMGANNPILSIHDQGAGGPSNVLTELLEPLGGSINIRGITLGDKNMSVLQIWSAEFQESYGLLISPEHIETFKLICQREQGTCEVLGEIDGSGKVIVNDPLNNETPVDLNLEQVLSNMPQKTFEMERSVTELLPLNLPAMTIAEAITKVFKLPSVGSKGFLVHKVDRSVTGLIAQQQTCGIAQIAIADAAVNAQGYFGITGTVSAVGESPIKMLIDPKAGARMAVGEMLTNMAGVKVSSMDDIRCRANWMWPAKLPHEGPLMYDAAVAMSDMMVQLGIAIDGGKDSLSMAATIDNEIVKAPGSLVIVGYAPVNDITKKVTPDIKRPGDSRLAFIDLGNGKNRLGGSALAQAYGQVGNESSDVDDPIMLKKAFMAIQQMIDSGLILSIHDKSDGGLITTISEMCMASHCGFRIRIPYKSDHIATLFNEELGWVIEYGLNDQDAINEICTSFDIPISFFGRTFASEKCSVITNESTVWKSTITELRVLWESTSTQLEKLQVDSECALQESVGHEILYPNGIKHPAYELMFTPKATAPEIVSSLDKPRVAVIREQGTNGEREMQAVCFAAGLEPWDVSMHDLISGAVTLDSFQGIIFAGGFSYMDTFGSAKGWAGTILFNSKLNDMFNRFYNRHDTFSLGVCNGCQLMALLGWVPWKGIEIERQPRFIHNNSGRFESRWSQVEIMKSNAILLQGMEGSKLGIWTAHGEGKLFFPDQSIYHDTCTNNLAPIRYINPFGHQTMEYPHNPNGSPDGIAALVSVNGRHLAMMPHPERCFQTWQSPWSPSEWKGMSAGPWLRMFQNARAWCITGKV